MRSDHLSKHKRTHSNKTKFDMKPEFDLEAHADEDEDDGGMGEMQDDDEQEGMTDEASIVNTENLIRVQQCMPATLAEMQAAE